MSIGVSFEDGDLKTLVLIYHLITWRSVVREIPRDVNSTTAQQQSMRLDAEIPLNSCLLLGFYKY